MESKAAILGGKPVFEKPIAFARPTLPPYEEMESGFRQIIESGMVTKGEYLNLFEKSARDYLGVPFALGVSNCTTGLFMLIKSLGLKGEVIVPSFSFMSSFHVIEMAGLKPVFADCEPDTFTVDSESVEKAITDKTSAIMAVNIFGNPPDLDKLKSIAKAHNIKFIMDSAHSFGTLYHGEPMGCHGDGEVFSTSATKLLATGEGGVVTTRQENIHKFIETFREYGNAGDYDPEMAGTNGRMSEFHAYLGMKLMPRVEGFARARNEIAGIYKDGLGAIPGISFQKIRENSRSSYKDFGILVDEKNFGLNRDQIAAALAAEGIGTRRYFFPPGHMQKAYKKYRCEIKNSLANTEYLSAHTLMMPIYSHMPENDVKDVIRAVGKIYENREKISRLDEIGQFALKG